MNCENVLFEKNFSKLGSLQEHRTIVYRLIELKKEGSNIYGIELTEESKGATKKLATEGLSRDRAVEILTFLYENAVTVSVAKEVVADLLSA